MNSQARPKLWYHCWILRNPCLDLNSKSTYCLQKHQTSINGETRAQTFLTSCSPCSASRWSSNFDTSFLWIWTSHLPVGISKRSPQLRQIAPQQVWPDCVLQLGQIRFSSCSSSTVALMENLPSRVFKVSTRRTILQKGSFCKFRLDHLQNAQIRSARNCSSSPLLFSTARALVITQLTHNYSKRLSGNLY